MTNNLTSIEDRVIEFVSSLLKRDTIDINCDLEQMGMDSVVFIQIVVRLEELFEIEFIDTDVRMGYFNTPQKISEMIKRYKGVQ